MKKIYFFGFDEVITKKDSTFLFLKFCDSKKFYMNYIWYFPLFFLSKLKILDFYQVKKDFVIHFFQGFSRKKLESYSLLFFQKYYPDLFKENFLSFIDSLDKEKHRLYIVTSSLDIWVLYFSEKVGARLISSEIKEENFSFLSKNSAYYFCFGEEKILKIRQILSSQNYDKSIAFGIFKNEKLNKKLSNWVDEIHLDYF